MYTMDHPVDYNSTGQELYTGTLAGCLSCHSSVVAFVPFVVVLVYTWPVVSSVHR
ncbi:hypothetical protein D1872_226630 [compost metagenome]